MRHYESGHGYDTLAEIREYISTLAKNAHFFADKTRGDSLTEALADLDHGNLDKAIAVLERYEHVRRYRSDEESDLEGIPAADHQSAIKLASWVQYLKERRT